MNLIFSCSLLFKNSKIIISKITIDNDTSKYSYDAKNTTFTIAIAIKGNLFRIDSFTFSINFNSVP